jgi:hypothetical protein
MMITMLAYETMIAENILEDTICADKVLWSCMLAAPFPLPLAPSRSEISAVLPCCLLTCNVLLCLKSPGRASVVTPRHLAVDHSDEVNLTLPFPALCREPLRRRDKSLRACIDF